MWSAFRTRRIGDQGEPDAAALGPIEQVEQALQRLELVARRRKVASLRVGIGLVLLDRQVRQERGEDRLVGAPDDRGAIDVVVDRDALRSQDLGKGLEVDRVAVHQGAVHIEDQSFQHRAVSRSVSKRLAGQGNSVLCPGRHPVGIATLLYRYLGSR